MLVRSGWPEIRDRIIQHNYQGALQGTGHGRKAVLDIGILTAGAMDLVVNHTKKRFYCAMLMKKALILGVVAAAGLGLGGCSSINESRGYVADGVLSNAVQPGIDNLRSVEGTLGRPTFASQYGEKTWYYVSSVTGRQPLVRPRINSHSVLAVKFDDAGNVVSAERSGVEKVAYFQPDGDETPTLGRERTFLEDLFGNIGQVGAGPGGGGAPGGP